MWQHPALVQEGQVLGLTFRVEGSGFRVPHGTGPATARLGARGVPWCRRPQVCRQVCGAADDTVLPVASFGLQSRTVRRPQGIALVSSLLRFLSHCYRNQLASTYLVSLLTHRSEPLTGLSLPACPLEAGSVAETSSGKVFPISRRVRLL